VLRFGKKVYKKTLRTSNKKKANIRKLKILQHFKDKLNMDKVSLANDMLQVITIIEEDDDVEEAKRVIKQINSTAMNGVSDSEKLNKITTITEEEIKYSTIEEEEIKFYEDYRKTNLSTNKNLTEKQKEELKEKVEKRIKEYESTFKYLYLKFPKETRLLHILQYDDWDNFRDFLIALPKNAVRRYGTKKHGTDIQSIIDNIIDECEEKGEEAELLNTRTINKHFNIFSMFLNFLVRTRKIKSNPINSMVDLHETPNPYQNFTNDDIVKIYQGTKDKEIRDFYSVALYTGIRLSAIISIKKEDIDLQNNILSITRDKTTNGVRTISIHKNIKRIFEDFKNSSREHLFFNTDNKDRVQKMINPILAEILGEKKTIHGFRKSFTIELFKATKDINLRKYIVGHSQKDDITFTIYNLENIDFKEMEDIINKINFPIATIKQKSAFDMNF
jgi:integrase